MEYTIYCVRKISMSSRFKEQYNKNFFRKKTNYRLSKRLKHQSKIVVDKMMKKFYTKPIGLIDLLVGLGLYKDVLLLKLIFIIVPFFILFLFDDIVIAMIIATVDIFLCALVFSMTVTGKHEAIVDNKFDYDLYRNIKSKKVTKAILIMTFVSIILTLVGHFSMKNFLLVISKVVSK